MDTNVGFYSLVQFCPDYAAAESVNIGVVAFCPETKSLVVHVSKNNSRIMRVFGQQICNPRKLQHHKDGLSDWLLNESEKFYSLEKAKTFLANQVNQIIFTPPRPAIWRNGMKEGAIALFNQFVVRNISENHKASNSKNK